jgi:hypothetical protein
VSGLIPAHGLRRRHDGLPRAAGRQAGWTLAWRPGPAEEAAPDARKRGARRALVAQAPRAARARAGAVKRSTAARSLLAGGKVLPVSTVGVGKAEWRRGSP